MNNKKLTLIIVILMTFCIMYPLAVIAEGMDDYVFLIYGSPMCPYCMGLKKFLEENYGSEHVLFCDVSANSTCRTLFEKIILALKLPPQLSAIPFTIVLVGDKATGVVVGAIEDRKLWDKLIQETSVLDSIPIYTGAIVNGTKTYVIVGEIGLDSRTAAYFFTHGELPSSQAYLTNTQPGIEANEESCTEYVCLPENNNSTNGFESTMGKEQSTTTYKPGSRGLGLDYIGLIAMTISLALVDSINPCTIYLYTLLLVAASLSAIAIEKRVNKRRVIAIGLAFALAVMVGYILLGLGLLTVMASLPRILFIVIGVGFGLWVIYSAFMGKEKIVAKGRMVKLLPRASKNIVLSIALGLLATFTLLPCSAGPYIVFTGIASKLPLIQAIPLLLLYNTIFILPLIAVLIAVLLGISRARIRELIIKHNRTLSVVAGALLIIISIYIALTSY